MSGFVVWRYLRASRRCHAMAVVRGQVSPMSMCGLQPRPGGRWYGGVGDERLVVVLVTKCKRCRHWAQL